MESTTSAAGALGSVDDRAVLLEPAAGQGPVDEEADMAREPFGVGCSCRRTQSRRATPAGAGRVRA